MIDQLPVFLDLSPDKQNNCMVDEVIKRKRIHRKYREMAIQVNSKLIEIFLALFNN